MDNDKITFTYQPGTYCYTRMLTDLCNTPATFQRASEIILTGVRWKRCHLYIDNVSIFAKNIWQHVKNIEKVLILHSQAGVALKLPRGHFFQEKTEYLSRIFVPGRSAAASRIVDAIEAAVSPTDCT